MAEGTDVGCSPELRVSGRIFAILGGDRLVLELPHRCTERVHTELARPVGRGQDRKLEGRVRLRAGIEDR